jgi:hypothetical protein
MSQIQEFIKNNNLSFEEGSRNTTVVVLIGYAQHLGLTETELDDELSEQYKEDAFICEEVTRLFDYCKARNYKNYWSTPLAKETYKF